MDDDEFTYSVEDLKKALGASITDLSNILGVSRQSVYGWINGGGMTEENMGKMRDLSKAALIFDNAKVRPNSHMLNRALLNGKSFVALVRGSACGESMAKRLVKVIHQEDRQRAAFSRRFALRPAPDISDVGIPHFVDDAP
jgi:predicted transcriptional regulator